MAEDKASEVNPWYLNNRCAINQVNIEIEGYGDSISIISNDMRGITKNYRVEIDYSSCFYVNKDD